MTTRLIVRAGRTAPPKSIAELIDASIDRLCELRQIAGDERRGHARTEQLIDGLYLVGSAVRRIGRE